MFCLHSKKDKKSVWWHTNDNDPKEHITVRYNRLIGGDRVHIYRDGSVNFKPQKPKPKPKRAVREAEEVESDDSAVISDEDTEGA